MSDRVTWFSGILLALLAVGGLDLAIGSDVPMFALYLFPIVAAAWRFGLTTGLLIAFMSLGLWDSANGVSARSEVHPLVTFWTLASTLACFAAAAGAAAHIRAIEGRSARVRLSMQARKTA